MKFDAILATTCFLGHTGYNNHSRNFFTHLNKYLPVYINNYTSVDNLQYLTEEERRILDRRIINTPNNFINIILSEVNHQTFYHGYSGNGKIAYTVWETTRYPNEFINKLLEFNQLWVPSQWQKRISIEQGYPEEKIYVIPEGIDINKFYPNKTKQNDKFQFLVVGKWEYRKSTEEIIRSFLKTFGDSNEVELLLLVDNPFAVDGRKDTEERLFYYGLNSKNIKVLHFLSEREYINTLQNADCFVSCSRAEGWNLPLCCPEKTKVICNEKITNIEDIKKGDIVPTHTNKNQKVINIMKRYYNDDLIKIKLHNDFEEIKVTPEHPIFVIKRERFITKKGKFGIIKTLDPQWIQAKDIRKGDLIIKSNINENKEYQNKYIDLSLFDEKLQYNENKVWYKTGYNNKKEHKKYNRYIKIGDLSYIFGWYIAEGCDGIYKCCLTLNIKEEKIAIKWLNNIEKIFGIKGSYTKYKTKIQVRVSSKIITKIMSIFCGHNAYNKKIPKEILFGDKNNLKYLIDEYGKGDGYNNGKTVSCSTKSYILARHLIIGNQRIGRKASIFKNKREDYIITWHINDKIRHSNKSWWHKNNDIVQLVKEIKKEKYNGFVYNFEVEEDNSYILINGTLHNCESIACGVPTICSDYGAQLDFAKNISKLVPIIDHRVPNIEELNIIGEEIQGTYAEPDFNELSNSMLEVFKNYSKYKEQAYEGSRRIRKEFTWDNAAKKAVDAINQIKLKKWENTKHDIIKTELTIENEHPRVDFTCLSNFKNKEYLVCIDDLKTGLNIYSNRFKLLKGKSIWMKINAVRKDLSGICFRILDNEKEKEIYNKTFDFNNNIDFVIKNKKIDIKTEPDDRAWYTFYEIFGKEVYKNEDCEIEKNDIVVDFGANYGFFSLYALNKGAREVFAYEPSPKTFPYLKNNVKNFPQINIINKAVSNKNDVCKFYSYDVSGVSTMNKDRMKITHAPDVGKEKIYDIECIGINNIIKDLKSLNINHIDYLKMDVEGEEYKILMAIDEEYLSNNIKKIYGEYHVLEDDKINDIKIKLKRCGFSVLFKETHPQFKNGYFTAWKNKKDFSNYPKRNDWFNNYQKIEGTEFKGNREIKNRTSLYKKEDFKDSSVIDIGCNIGQMCLQAVEWGAFEVTGIDYDKTAIKNAIDIINKKKIENVKYMVDDVENPVFWNSIVNKVDVSLLLSVYDTQELKQPNMILSRLSSITNEVMYFEGHGEQPYNKYMKPLINNTDFTSLVYVGNVDNDNRTLIRCSRERMNMEQGLNKILELSKKYNKIAVVGKTYSGKSTLRKQTTKQLESNGFTVIDDFGVFHYGYWSGNKIYEIPNDNNRDSDFPRVTKHQLEEIRKIEKLVMFDTRALEYIEDFDVVVVVHPSIDFLIEQSEDSCRSPILKHINNLKEYHTIYNDIENDDVNFKINLTKNKEERRKILDEGKIDNIKENINDSIIILNAYANDEEKIKSLEKCIEQLKKTNIDILLVTHNPVDIKIQENVDYYIYDKSNKMLPPDNTNFFWYDSKEFYYKTFKLEIGRHSYATLCSLYNGLQFAKNIGKKYAYHIEYDYIIDDEDIERFKDIRNKNEVGLFQSFNMNPIEQKEDDALSMIFFFVDIDFFLQTIPPIKTPEEYIKESEGNTMSEMFLYKKLKEYFDKLTIYKGKRSIPEYFKNSLYNKMDEKNNKENKILIDIVEDKINKKPVLVILNQTDERIIFKITKNNGSIDNISLSEHHHYTEYIDEKFNEISVEYNNRKEVIRNISKGYIEFKKDIKEKFEVSFIDGAKLYIKEGKPDERYTVKFIDKDTNKIEYENKITRYCWSQTNKKYFVNWLIEVYNEQNKLVFKYNYDAKGKKVFIVLDSNSLGDDLAWIPYVEEFRKKHQAEVICCSTWYDKLYKESYPKIKFTPRGSVVHGLYAMYWIGWFRPTPDYNKNPIDYRTIPLQKTASDILGLEYKEIKPLLNKFETKRNIEGKYICIANQSTAKAKYWNREGGWQEVIDYLNSIGYKVVYIAKEPLNYMGTEPLKNIIDKSGNIPIEDRISDLTYCDMFIGIGSGLSWLAWSLNIPVVMISGFSKPFCEFTTGIERIINENVCNGCFNDIKFELDRGNWNWCPRNKDFVCTKEIHPKEVIKSIEKIITPIYYPKEEEIIKTNLSNLLNKKFELPLIRIAYEECMINNSYSKEKCHVEKDDIVLDIGGNLGFFSLHAVEKGVKKIYTYEPEPTNYKCLVLNTEKYRHIIKPYNFAVSEVSNIFDLHLDKNAGGHSLYYNDINKTKLNKSIKVKCLSINEVIEKHGHINFLKIDAEGAEESILKEIEDKNLNIIDKIALEYHHMIFNFSNNYQIILNKLSKFYKYERIVDRNGHTSMIYFWKEI